MMHMMWHLRGQNFGYYSSLQNTFHSGGFLHPIPQEVDVINRTNNQEDSSDPEEEWKSYLNDTGYASQEEVYTPSWSPLEEFRGMSELHDNNKVFRTKKCHNHPLQQTGIPSREIASVTSYRIPRIALPIHQKFETF